MSAILQLEQPVQVCGGLQNVVTPRLQSPQKDEQFFSGKSSNIDFPVCLPIVAVLSPKPSLPTKETFQATNVAAGIITTALADTFSSITRRDRRFMLDHIDIDGGILLFAEPIIANISFDGNVYSCRNEDLGIISMSANLEDCIKDFKDEVAFIWNEYGREEDSRLTSDAKELKRRVLSHLRK